MSLNKWTRRGFLGGAAAMAGLAAFPALAIDPDGAQRFVSRAIADLESIVNSGKTGDALQSSVQGFFRQYADVDTVARSVIGSPWRGMSGSQKQAYTSAFESYVTRKYTGQFDILKGGKAQITGAKDGGKAGVLVTAEFVRAGKRPVSLDLQISDQSGSPKVLDMRLDGVSMISTEREQVRAMLAQSGNDVNSFIKTLNES